MADDPFEYFRVEARELLDGLVQGVLELEKGAAAPRAVAGLLRLAHTLKGAARVVKQAEIADHAHAVEDVLDPFRDSTEPLPHARIETLLELSDGIRSRIAALPFPDDAEPGPSSPSRPDEPTRTEPTRTIRTDIFEMDALLDGVGEAHAQLGELRAGIDNVDRARGLVKLIMQQLAAPSTQGHTLGDTQARIDKARSVAGELRSVIGALEHDLGNGVALAGRELSQVRDAIERLRLAPAGALFTDLERAVRDVAQAQRKRVVFEGRGADVRLDADVLTVAQTALAQIVRNAVAHGIEPEGERLAAGKPADGHVTLDVARRGRRAVFTCRDDGRGIDLEAVRGAGRRKGVLSEDTDRLGPEALTRLLLRGGISTSDAVTELSGRGIGLDVASHSAERLGGDITVSTEVGNGTTVVLEVPVSLASFEALGVAADAITAMIPLDAVRRTLRIRTDEIASSSQGESIIYDGSVVPFLSLPAALSGRTAGVEARTAWSAVVVVGGRGVAAIGVDRLAGVSSIVARPLPESVPASAFVSAVSLDAQGNPLLVLDADGLVAEAERDRQPVPAPDMVRRPILVIDDSLTTRMLEQSILESAGYDVDIAVSGEEALHKARTTQYLLFLIDVEMPGIDGFTFIERTKAIPALRNVPCILVTSRASPEDRERGREVGASAYITKSEFDQGQLLERIREVTVG